MKAATFPFPSTSNGSNNVTLTLFEHLPPLDGTLRRSEGHILGLHLGKPVPIRQQREELRFEGTYSRGDLTVIPAGWRTRCWTRVPSDYLHIELGRELVNETAGDLVGGGSRDVELPCIFQFDDPICRELALSMLDEAEAEGEAARMYTESAAAVIALRLLRMRNPIPGAAARSGLPARTLRRAKEFLHEEMGRNPGVRELSSVVQMNVHHFSRMFKRSTGLAPHQYLSSIRLERAKRQLSAGRGTMIQIAYEIGFSTPSQFSAFFRKRTGVSPSQYRQRLRAHQ